MDVFSRFLQSLLTNGYYVPEICHCRDLECSHNHANARPRPEYPPEPDDQEVLEIEWGGRNYP